MTNFGKEIKAMINIRNSVFETNSSSSHSITIGDNLPENLVIPKRLEVCYLEQGRDFCYDRIETRYTAAVVLAYRTGHLDKLLTMLDNLGVEEKILCKSEGKEFWNSYGIEASSISEIDPYDAEDYIDEILESEDSLKRWLFSPESDLSGEDDNYSY